MATLERQNIDPKRILNTQAIIIFPMHIGKNIFQHITFSEISEEAFKWTAKTYLEIKPKLQQTYLEAIKIAEKEGLPYSEYIKKFEKKSYIQI